MDHIGLDIGSRKTYFCICKPNGEVDLEATVKTELLAEFFTEMEGERGKCRVVMESCAE